MFTNYQPPLGTTMGAGEPSIGIDPATGNVFLQATSQTQRVTFDDAAGTASWVNVARGMQATIVNLDPILFTDQTTGRTYAGGLAGECSLLAFTDDDGQSWTSMANPCAPPAFDHETIASGPWHEPRPADATYGRVVYYCVQTVLDECSASHDGGVTFGAPAPLNGAADCARIFGHVKVASDGAAYVPLRYCGGPSSVFGSAVVGQLSPGLAVTVDNGQTWSTHTITGAVSGSNSFDPSIAVTPSGWLYEAWTDADSHAKVALSRDHGASWAAVSDLAAPVGVASTVFASAVAGDDGRAAVAFLGTTDAGNAFSSGFAGTWDLYVAFTYDAGATWTTQKVTTDPVQRGWICTSGTTCTAGRNLLDFIDATLDAQGRVVVAYADGCVEGCAAPTGTKDQSTAALASIARQEGGLCLLAGACGSASGTLLPPPPPDGDACDSRTVVFSSNSHGTPGVNGHAAACIVEGFTGSLGPSTAFINPGSDRVSVRFLDDLGVPELRATLTGLGLDHVTVTLAKHHDATLGTTTYDSANVPIDPLARGELSAVVTLPSGSIVSTVTFRTVA